MIRAVPVSLKEANSFIRALHRHHSEVQGHKFSIGCEVGGVLVGVCTVGRPVSRHLDNGRTLEVTRLCTDGSKNVCSFLYSRASRVAQELGYEKIITYILSSEMGTSLKASGWYLDEKECGGGNWNCKARPRELEPMQMSLFGTKEKYPIEKKQRWAKDLKQ